MRTTSTRRALTHNRNYRAVIPVIAVIRVIAAMAVIDLIAIIAVMAVIAVIAVGPGCPPWFLGFPGCPPGVYWSVTTVYWAVAH